ncbi:hypothetical protein M4L39_00370 [Staphylococcus equorum]|uniref:Uncharacterized protein n=1 Tax=Staphylococcus equorum TaxID=246432 RepID=A0A9X4R0G7_9STAP|nr:hypothetical protein [Staphylococcus equorum]MDG0841877.1 hypothetical protein [Staphylococcus equorum]MDG0858071.1 hypothetical protein [Staphylococcus equorum]
MKKLLTHLIVALTLAIILFLTTLLFDLFKSMHLTALLLNIDFLIDDNASNVILEFLIHVGITISLYASLYFIYKKWRNYYYIALTCVMISFLALYPLLIYMAVNPVFQFHFMGYICWIIAHIIFLVCTHRAIKFMESKL